MPATTPNIGLTQWTTTTEKFNHSQLSLNFAALDAHDHTGSPTKGLLIPTGGLANLAVVSGKIADNAVITAKILDANVTQAKLANQSVSAAKVGILPRSRAYHSVGQTIPNAVLTSLTFNSERFDTDSMHDNVTNATRITCKTAGLYAIGAHISWAVNTTGIRQIAFMYNAGAYIASDIRSAFAVQDVHQSLQTIYYLNVNDFIEVRAQQTSGVGLDVGSQAQYSPEFYAAFLSN